MRQIVIADVPITNEGELEDRNPKLSKIKYHIFHKMAKKRLYFVKIGGNFMIDLMLLYEITILLLLSIICYLLRFWSKDHADTMSIILHTLQEIRKKIQ